MKVYIQYHVFYKKEAEIISKALQIPCTNKNVDFWPENALIVNIGRHLLPSSPTHASCLKINETRGNRLIHLFRSLRTNAVYFCDGNFFNDPPHIYFQNQEIDGKFIFVNQWNRHKDIVLSEFPTENYCKKLVNGRFIKFIPNNIKREYRMLVFGNNFLILAKVNGVYTPDGVIIPKKVTSKLQQFIQPIQNYTCYNMFYADFIRTTTDRCFLHDFNPVPMLDTKESSEFFINNLAKKIDNIVKVYSWTR